MRPIRYLLAALASIALAFPIAATQQVINVGAAANDGTGDPARTAGQKINANFAELYTQVGPQYLSAVITAASTDDYTPSGGWSNVVGRLDIDPTTVDSTLTGLVAGSDGQRVWVCNTDAVFNLKLVVASSSSTAANRFRGPPGTFTLSPGSRVLLVYYGGSVNRWVIG